MTRLVERWTCFAVVSAVTCLLLSTAGLAQDTALRISSGNNTVHIFPNLAGVETRRQQAGTLAHNGGTPPLTYHGGPVMLTQTFYAIFWLPSHLQNGSATGITTKYQTVLTSLLKEYGGHSVANINTQYYQIAGGVTSYIKNSGKFGGSYVDTSPYPTSGCPSVTSNCINDTQIQAEIAHVMDLKGWTGGLSKIFLLFTSSGEVSCMDSAGTQCSTNTFCAYHGHFLNSSSAQVIYGNEPYGNPSNCQVSGAPSPNGDAIADAAATAASHEMSEAITDPLLNAWYDSSGSEIGDECGYYYGRIDWLNGTANQKWDGKYFLVQTEYNNHLSNLYISDANYTGCFASGPEL